MTTKTGSVEELLKEFDWDFREIATKSEVGAWNNLRERFKAAITHLQEQTRREAVIATLKTFRSMVDFEAYEWDLGEEMDEEIIKKVLQALDSQESGGK